MAEDSYSLDGYAEAPGIAPIVLAYGLVGLSNFALGLLVGWML